MVAPEVRPRKSAHVDLGVDQVGLDRDARPILPAQDDIAGRPPIRVDEVDRVAAHVHVRAVKLVRRVRRPSPRHRHVVIARAVVVPVQTVTASQLLPVVELLVGGGSAPEVGDLEAVRVVERPLHRR